MERYSVDKNYSYCLGMSLTIELIKNKSEYVVEVILSNKAFKNAQLSYLLDLCNKNNIKVTYDDNTIDKLSLKENCYCIGVFNKYETNIDNNNQIVLYGFNDYGELGTVLRSCVSFDFKNIVLVNSDIDYFDPRCIRASMGSFFHVNIKKNKSLDEYLNGCTNNIYPLLSKASISLSNLVLKKPYSIIISQTYNGLDDLFEDGFYVEHKALDEISLSIRSSIVIHNAYNQNLKR